MKLQKPLLIYNCLIFIKFILDIFLIFIFYFSFELNFDSVEVYCNDEETRTFVALKVDLWSHKILYDITLKIDDILEEYKLPKFYDVSRHNLTF